MNHKKKMFRCVYTNAWDADWLKDIISHEMPPEVSYGSMKNITILKKEWEENNAGQILLAIFDGDDNELWRCSSVDKSVDLDYRR